MPKSILAELEEEIQAYPRVLQLRDGVLIKDLDLSDFEDIPQEEIDESIQEMLNG